VSPLGFGAFKIGRNEGIKYDHGYALPEDDEAFALVRSVVDLGITLIDTAPAYGASEARVGRGLALLPRERTASIVVSTKVGETFDGGRSTYDFSPAAIERSIERSHERLAAPLGRDRLDLVFVHSPGDRADRAETDLVRGEAFTTLARLRNEGLVRAIGFSGKSPAAALAAIELGYDALMVELHPLDTSHAEVVDRAGTAGVGVLVKKPLASGRIPPAEALPFILAKRAVAACVVGSLSAHHLAECLSIAQRAVANRTTSSDHDASGAPT
jgi:aryl-alcohol dehydrogenase-like predicted oxidoreductase